MYVLMKNYDWVYVLNTDLAGVSLLTFKHRSFANTYFRRTFKYSIRSVTRFFRWWTFFGLLCRQNTKQHFHLTPMHKVFRRFELAVISEIQFVSVGHELITIHRINKKKFHWQRTYFFLQFFNCLLKFNQFFVYLFVFILDQQCFSEIEQNW